MYKEYKNKNKSSNSYCWFLDLKQDISDLQGAAEST